MAPRLSPPPHRIENWKDEAATNDETHPEYWLYGQTAGGMRYYYGDERYNGKQIRELGHDYIRRNSNVSPQIRQAFLRYDAGLREWIKENYMDVVIPVGVPSSENSNSHRGETLGFVASQRDFGWMRWMVDPDQSWQRDRHYIFWDALDHFVSLIDSYQQEGNPENFWEIKNIPTASQTRAPKYPATPQSQGSSGQQNQLEVFSSAVRIKLEERNIDINTSSAPQTPKRKRTQGNDDKNPVHLPSPRPTPNRNNSSARVRGCDAVLAPPTTPVKKRETSPTLPPSPPPSPSKRGRVARPMSRGSDNKPTKRQTSEGQLESRIRFGVFKQINWSV
ncbi:hypothetical protein FA15DRAFT_757314 [Coprinopsis marcescibilis]|uniref:Uncharacterized protein n=1 Tax=Coprinopsis marcescibilis TaxID=230819 RepID=A0A5C3KSR3_COPMA|nr:hypothetical protein FA15DRAFT_757314 [Coprinopsis marcescibilis]